MRAITVRDRAAGVAGVALADLPYPHAAENDVIVRVHAAGFTPGEELDWPATWTDRAGRDRTPSVPGHELSGVVVDLAYGTTGLTIGQRVFGMTDWARDGSLAEYAAVGGSEPRPAGRGPRPHGGRRAADLRLDCLAGPVRPRPAEGGPDGAGARRGWGRLLDRRPARAGGGSACDRHRPGGRQGSGARPRCGDLPGPPGRAVGECGRGRRGVRRDRRRDPRAHGSAGPPGGTLVSIAAPPTVWPDHGSAVFFVVEPDRDRLADLAQRVRDGRLSLAVGSVVPLTEAPAGVRPRTTYAGQDGHPRHRGLSGPARQWVDGRLAECWTLSLPRAAR